MNFHISQDKFQSFLFELASLDDYRYKFLRHEVVRAMQGKSKFYDNSILNIQEDSWILIIHAGALLVYGNNWSKHQFDEIKTSFALNKFTNYLMTGDAGLIKTLLEFYEVNNHMIEMERIFYRTKTINSFTDNSLKISPAIEKEINILAGMLQQYYHEEYEGENDKTIEEMVLKVETSISKKNMYVLKNSANDILSFCTIISPDIGILFTNPEYRNKGYGKIILSYCSELLLESNEEIYLMSVKSRTESNAAFKTIGFEPFFEYSYIRINNS